MMGSEPGRPHSGAYFGCGGAACLGLAFWAVIACCMLLTVVGLSTELDSGDSELVAAFYALSQIMVGSLAFCYSMAAILVVFVGYGIFQQTRKSRLPGEGEAHDLNTVLLYFFLFVGGMILAAAFPTLAFEYPNTNGWLVAVGVTVGLFSLFYGMLMLWLTLVAYESYLQAEEQ